MRIGCDLDEVCFDFAKSVRDYLIFKGYSLPDSRPTKWDFYEDWGLDRIQFVDHCRNGIESGHIFSGPVMDNAVAAFAKIKSLGHTIHIVTARDFGGTIESSKKSTLKWLERHKFLYDTITFAEDKTCIPTDMFIEDRLENYDDLIKAGVDAYLVNRPWNMPEDHRSRVSCIGEFADIIESKTLKTIGV